MDGRLQRSAQSREAVIDALLELFEEGDYQPSTADIAERAGISPRSLFRYFDDVADLTQAAIDRALASAPELVALKEGPDASTSAKIADLVQTRIALHKATAPAARAARACAHRNDVVAKQIEGTRAFLRSQLRKQFGPELKDRRTVLPAIEVLTSFESYEQLRASGQSPANAMLAGLAWLLGGAR
jgi:AcrR family transcriptional regulator